MKLKYKKICTSSSFLDTAFLAVFQRIRSEQAPLPAPLPLPLPLPCPTEFWHIPVSTSSNQQKYGTGWCRTVSALYKTMPVFDHLHRSAHTIRMPIRTGSAWTQACVGTRMSVPVRFRTQLVCAGRYQCR